MGPHMDPSWQKSTSNGEKLSMLSWDSDQDARSNGIGLGMEWETGTDQAKRGLAGSSRENRLNKELDTVVNICPLASDSNSNWRELGLVEKWAGPIIRC